MDRNSAHQSAGFYKDDSEAALQPGSYRHRWPLHRG